MIIICRLFKAYNQKTPIRWIECLVFLFLRDRLQCNFPGFCTSHCWLGTSGSPESARFWLLYLAARSGQLFIHSPLKSQVNPLFPFPKCCGWPLASFPHAVWGFDQRKQIICLMLRMFEQFLNQILRRNPIKFQISGQSVHTVPEVHFGIKLIRVALPLNKVFGPLQHRLEFVDLGHLGRLRYFRF